MYTSTDKTMADILGVGAVVTTSFDLVNLISVATNVFNKCLSCTIFSMEYFCKLIFSCFRKLISSHIWNHNCSNNHLAAEKFTRILTLETKRCLFTCEQCGISLLSCFKSLCLNMNSLLKSFLDTNINMLFLSKSFLILLSFAFC